MLDPKGFVTSWNAGAERIKGFQTEEIIGQHFSKFYTDEDREAGLPQKILETAKRACRKKCSKPPRRPAATTPRAGACARTGPASGRASSSMRSTTTKAS